MHTTTLHTHRYVGLDLLKAIAAMAVVYIHCFYSGYWGESFAALARFAVPVFFMITGYFIDDIIARGRWARYCKKIVRLTGVAVVVYVVFVALQRTTHHDVIPFFTTQLAAESLCRWVLWGKSVFGPHLWYMYALLYSLVVIRLFVWIRLPHCYDILLAVGLLLLGLYLGHFSTLPDYYLRNALFIGLPFILIGRSLARYHRGSYVGKRVDNLAPVLIALGIIGTLWEYHYDYTTLGVTGRDLYYATPLLAMGMWLWFARLACLARPFAIGAWMGLHTATLVYIYHIMILNVWDFLALGRPWEGLYRHFFRFPLVLLSTILAVMLYNAVRARVFTRCCTKGCTRGSAKEEKRTQGEGEE